MEGCNSHVAYHVVKEAHQGLWTRQSVEREWACPPLQHPGSLRVAENVHFGDLSTGSTEEVEGHVVQTTAAK